MTGWLQHAVCYRCTKSDPDQVFKQSNSSALEEADLKSVSKMIHIKNTVCEYYIFKGMIYLWVYEEKLTTTYKTINNTEISWD